MEIPKHKFVHAGGGICEECAFPKSHEIHIPEAEESEPEPVNEPEHEKITA
jgi:hypothetical protein